MGAPSVIQIKVDANTQSAVSSLERVAGTINKIGASLSTGFGIDIAGRITSFLTQIPNLIQDTVTQGVRFNATLEDARLGIAAVIKQFQPEKFANFSDALIESERALESLKKKALESPAKFGELVSAFQAITGAASGANIPLEKQVDLVVLMSQSLAGLGIRSEQIIQESRALITGNINQDAAAAKILGITAADIARAKETGQLYDFLTEKLGAFAEAAKIGASNYTTANSNMADSFEQTVAKLSEPIFETLKANFLSLTQEISKPEFKQSLETIAANIEKIVKVGFGLVQFTARHANAVSEVFQGVAIAVAGAALAFAGFQAAALVSSPLTAYGVILWGVVQAVRAGAEAWKLWKAKQNEALEEEETAEANNRLANALFKVTQEREKDGTLSAKQLKDLRERIALGRQFTNNDDAAWGFKLLSGVGDELIGRTASKNAKAKTDDAPAKIESKLSESEAKLMAVREQAALKIALAQNAIEETQNEIGYKSKLVSLEEYFAKKTELSKRHAEDEVRAINNQLESLAILADQTKNDPDKLNQIKADEIALRADLIAAEEKHKDQVLRIKAEEVEERKALNAEVLQDSLVAQERELQDRLNELSARRAALESNFAQTADEKRPEIIRLLREELEIYEQQVAALERKLLAASSPEERELIQQRLDSLNAQRNNANIGLAGTQGTPDPNSFRDQFTNTFAELREQMGTFAQNMAQTFQTTFNSAIGSISNGITGLIMKTMTWKEALLNVATTITTTLVQSLVTYAVRWIASQVLMATVGKALAAASLAANTAIASASSLIWAAPAALATIGSYGGAAAAAPFQIEAAKAMVIAGAAASGAFREGGYTGDGSPGDVAGVVHKDEYVMPSEQSWIFPFLERVRSGAVNAQNFSQNLSVSRPVTSEPNAAAMLPGLSGGGGAGGTPNVNVQGHSVKNLFVGTSDQDVRRIIEEEMPDRVEKIMRGMKREFGAT